MECLLEILGLSLNKHEDNPECEFNIDLAKDVGASSIQVM